MPTTIAGVLVALFAILPGLPGYMIFSRTVGSDWREKDWQIALRILGISLAGIVIYVMLADLLNLPQPLYVFPSTFTPESFNENALPQIAVSLSGHVAASVVVAFISVGAVRLIARLSPVSHFPCSWDSFVRNLSPEHWVVVRVSEGEVFAGLLQSADCSVTEGERDLILCEPASYEESSKNYVALPYQHLFLPASTIDSIATVHDPDLDKRITAIGKPIFAGE